MNKKLTIAILLVGFLFIIFTSGCAGDKTNSADKAKATQLTPIQTVNTAMAALKNSDTETFNKYIQHTAGKENMFIKHTDTKLSEQGKEFLQLVVADLSYQINGETINGDKATVDIKITNTDFSNIINLLIEKAMSEKRENEDARLNQMLKEADKNKTISRETKVNLIQQADGYKIILTEADINAICGGLFVKRNR